MAKRAAVADHADAEVLEAERQDIFFPYCPMNELCTKGGGHLGRCASYDEAVGKLMNHLVESPYHKMESEEAEAAITAAPDYIVSKWEKVWKKVKMRSQRLVRGSCHRLLTLLLLRPSRGSAVLRRAQVPRHRLCRSSM